MWKQLFEDDNGGFSMIRYTLFVVVNSIAFVFLESNIVNAIRCIKDPNLQFDILDLKQYMIAFLLTAIGGKVIQKKFERQGDASGDIDKEQDVPKEEVKNG